MEKNTAAFAWQEKRDKKAFLALEDGTVLHGRSVGATKDQLGECVFNTGMTGYQEILFDPSYSGQFVCMTYPEIGNTGINQADQESERIFVNAFLMQQLNQPSSWRSEIPLDEALIKAGIPALEGIDTRYLTSLLRDKGTLKSYLSVEGKVDEKEALEKAKSWQGLDNQDYASKVSCKEIYQWDLEGHLTASWGISETLPPIEMHIIAYDFGIKWNILRQLRLESMGVKVVPAKTSAKEVLALKPDAVFLSNGPADPAALPYAVEAVRELMGKLPMMGICLGHQIMGLASGGERCRLKFGHHGCNHPVMDLSTRKVEITSQNHNYSIEKDSLDASRVEVSHINLNDQTVEGLVSQKEKFFSVQYHPEACPGPRDPSYLFKRFRKLIEEA